jgi:CheY-like chemotaxis protein
MLSTPAERRRIVKSFRRMLVADGSIVVRALLGRSLALHADVVHAAANVDEAEAAVECEPTDLVFADMTLPGGGVCELGRRLERLSGPRPGLVALSLRPALEEETRVSLAGCLGYLAKPIQPRELARLLCSLGRELAPGPHRVEPDGGTRAVALDENGRAAMSWEAREVSRSGAFLLTDGPLPIGVSLWLELRWPWAARAIPVLAQVVRVRPPAWGELAGVEVTFVGTTPLDAAGIHDLHHHAARPVSGS